MKLGDFFTAKVQKDVAEFWPLPKPVTIAGHEVRLSLEGTLLLDPMMRLYEATGDPRYLQWCQWVVNSIDRWSVVGTVSNLDKVAAGTLPLNQIQPNVRAHTLHMNLLGFLRLYEVTGDTQFLNRTLGAWRRIMENYRYITGGVSVGEGYRDAHNLPNTGQVVETCASMSWLQLNQHLFELTGNQAHLDAMEALIWNHLFARTDMGRRWIPLSLPAQRLEAGRIFHRPELLQLERRPHSRNVAHLLLLSFRGYDSD